VAEHEWAINPSCCSATLLLSHACAEVRTLPARVGVFWELCRPNWGLLIGQIRTLKLCSYGSAGVLRAVDVDVIAARVVLDRFDQRGAHRHATLMVQGRCGR
jgi:hypothetical protein